MGQLAMRHLISSSQDTDAGANAAKYALIVGLMIVAIVTVALAVWTNLAADPANPAFWR